MLMVRWHHDIQLNDIQHDDISHNDAQKMIKNAILIMTLHNGTRYCCSEDRLCWLSFMMSVAYFIVMLCFIVLTVVILNIDKLSVVAPLTCLCGAMTLSIIILSIRTLSIRTLIIWTLSIRIVTIRSLSVRTLSKTIKNMTLSITIKMWHSAYQ
jgi:hypothetical protein